MDSNIDLRVYLRILGRGWLTIIICGILFAFGAGIIATLAPDTYKAEVVVYLSEPNFRFSLVDDAAVQAPSEQLLAALTSLAVSDRVIAQTLTEIQPQLAEERGATLSLETLRRGILTGTFMPNGTFILSARWIDPEETALIASTWARVFVDVVNNAVRISPDVEENVAAQRLRLEPVYSQAEAALVAFQSATPLLQLERARNARLDEHDGVMRNLDRLRMLEVNIDTLRTIFSAMPADTQPSIGDAYVLMSLQHQIVIAVDASLYAQIQVEQTITDTQTYRSMLNQLTVYEDGVRVQQTALNARREILLTEIDQAAAAYQTALNEQVRLQAELDRAREVYLSLTNTQDSVSIYNDTLGQTASIGSDAVVPTETINPTALVSAVIGGAGGVIVGIVLVFLLAYVRSERTSSNMDSTRANQAS